MKYIFTQDYQQFKQGWIIDNNQCIINDTIYPVYNNQIEFYIQEGIIVIFKENANQDQTRQQGSDSSNVEKVKKHK